MEQPYVPRKTKKVYAHVYEDEHLEIRRLISHGNLDMVMYVAFRQVLDEFKLIEQTDGTEGVLNTTTAYRLKYNLLKEENDGNIRP